MGEETRIYTDEELGGWWSIIGVILIEGLMLGLFFSGMG
jgi:hypothetical protein